MGKCIFSTSKLESGFQEMPVVFGQAAELCFQGRQGIQDNAKKIMGMLI